ncbi:MAG: transcription antitermination factor NusB [Candidatus Edwardsbacteria bacterium]
MGRRKARELALQVLYQIEITGDKPEKALTDVSLRVTLEPEVFEFIDQLVNGTIRNLEKIDLMIQGALENWQLERLAMIDRNILRLALGERMTFGSAIPAKVTINEAIELAKRYSTEDSGTFVNGVLDRLIEKE